MDLGIEGKVALVTASSRGLGRASAEAIAAEGARLVLCARDEGPLRDTEQAIAAQGTEVLALTADMADPATPERLVAATTERFGALDIVVANSGGPPPGKALELDDDAIRAAVEGNLLSSVRLVRSALPSMRARGGGDCAASRRTPSSNPSPAWPCPTRRAAACGRGRRRPPPISPPTGRV